MRGEPSDLSPRPSPTGDNPAEIARRLETEWWPELAEEGQRELVRSKWRSRGFTVGTLVASILFLVIAAWLQPWLGCCSLIGIPFFFVHVGNTLRREEARKREWLVDQPSQGEFSVKAFV